MPDREPWIKLKIGARRSGKIAALPNDAARLGWFYVLLEAKVQRHLGAFDDRRHFIEVLGRFGRYLPDYIAAGLAHEAPLGCAECMLRHPEAGAGQIVIHDYRKEQRDASNAERQERFRLRSRNGLDNDEVTPDVTARNGASNADRDATVTPDSRARRTTATATGTTRDSAAAVARDGIARAGRMTSVGDVVRDVLPRPVRGVIDELPGRGSTRDEG